MRNKRKFIRPILGNGMPPTASFLTLMSITMLLYVRAYSTGIPQQAEITPPDTIGMDTLPADSVSQVRRSADSLDAPVVYHAEDTTWFDLNNQKVYLLGNAGVQYKDIQLEADSIVFDWGRNEVLALGRKDSSGRIRGKPVFTQAGRSYQAERILYNFKTRKGKIAEIVTQEGEGYIRSETVKRLPDEVIYGATNLYTTCDKEHPHFYIGASRIKIIPDKAVVTGPANLVVADVRTPLFAPFGIFPISTKRKSGIIFPTYGEREDLGFYLENGGYYFGINDHIDLAVTGNVYSKGSWLVRGASRFSKRYKYSGGINLTYANTRTFVSEQNLYQPNTQFNVRLDFRQDPKAKPNSYFNANISFGTSGFNQLFGYAPTTYLNNVYQSSVSYNKRFPKTPLNLTVSASHQQSTLTRQVSMQLPVLNFSMSQVYPFKRKIQIGNPRWYEKIGLTYTLDARNQVSTADSTFFTEQTLDKLQWGARHTIPVSAPFQLFRYVTLSPSLNYSEVWAFQTINKTYDPLLETVDTDTVQGFEAGRDYSLNLSASTRLYGMYPFKKGSIKAIRHVLNPSVGYGFRPDFSDPKYGNYRTVQIDSAGTEEKYSIFQGSPYGGPSAGEFNGLSFGLSNNLEMKVASRKDTVSGTKKIKLLDALNLGGSYNFAADSLKLSTISLNARTTLIDVIGINFSSVFDPYIADSLGRRLNTFVWEEEKRLARLTSATVGLDAGFSSKKGGKQRLTPEQVDLLAYSGDRYADFSVPWNFNFGYNLFIRKINTEEGEDSTTLAQTLSINGSFNLTHKWRISGSTSYDFVNHEFPSAYIEIYRDLHCWEMSMRWIPFGIRQSYEFSIRVKASVLQDLKLKKTQGWYEY